MSFNKNINSIADYEEVKTVIEKGYLKGAIEGNFDLVMTTFHPDATMYGYSEGSLTSGSIRNLADYIEQFGPSKNMTTRIDVLSMTPTTATVRIELENAACGKNYTDYHQLIKLDGKWKVVSKLFHMYD
ncbi:nuclear transport factor 2 family protein [Paraburkholderia sp. BL25I1N1]|uniref:nuclear transport factor 2 family protein n=1 Tax=Paraburkholderia sp. BL25I1N1 TaxID=1938804 RepID=UPI000D083BBF|nr:nuclear transport factor 2 family protein [Paraburkholderia sp. BL25I1N1]PRX96459.1 putative lumazine-binding protein [Paraburkholderia sp. BL25I1N1]